MALADCNKPMIEANASPFEILEAGVQAICIVPLSTLGSALMEALKNYQDLDWTDNEKAVVGNFLELVYSKTGYSNGNG